MYKHLLVPIDGSPLSVDTVEQASVLARETGARMTIFHAQPDFGATGAGALLHAAAPQAFRTGAAGNAAALLAKAAAAARAAGAQCETASRVSDHPHEAIVEAACSFGCDLIFMASHRRRGLKSLVNSSVTRRVLQRSTLPVLVTAIDENPDASDARRAVAAIRDEHRSLAAVVHALEHEVAGIRDHGRQPDFALLRAMLFYIEQFPEKLHHPKEDAFLFRLLRARTHELDDVLDELQAQHVAGAEAFEQLRRLLDAYEAGSSTVHAFADAVHAWAQAQWRHIGAEEKLILPAAHQYLSEADWHEIATAFLNNGDPRFGALADESFNHLFTRLLSLASPVADKPTGMANNLGVTA